MFLFRKKYQPSYWEMVESLAEETKIRPHSYSFKFSECRTSKTVLKLPPEELRLFVLAAIDWLNAHKLLDPRGRSKEHVAVDCVRMGMEEVLRRRLPFTEDDLIVMLDWSLAQPFDWVRSVPQMIKVLENYLKDHPLSDPIRERVTHLVEATGREYATPDSARHQARLRDLIRADDLALPVEPGEAWTDAVIAEIGSLELDCRQRWVHLFYLCAQASGSSPSEKWQKAARQAVEELGFSVFKDAVLRWFPLVDQPRTMNSHRPVAGNSLWISPTNGDLLRALVWVCVGFEDREIARKLTALALSTYRKLPGIGPRCSRVGNACIWTLGHMPGMDALGQLALLKVRVKFIPAQKGIESTLRSAAERLDLPADEIEELIVPTYGLDEVGLRRETFGEYRAELVIVGSDSEIRWFQPDGKRQASAPKAVKEQFAEELKELTQAKKDIDKMLPAQSARIENLYLEGKSWNFAAWRERTLDHPLVGVLARRLIWKFSRGDQAASGIWWEGQIVDRDGRGLDWLDGETRVELWHPISVSIETVLAWRDWLEQRQVQQPFKQAHREVYLLTDAERQTQVYSNRFAAHIIKQHQFHALCGQRGWKNKLRLMVDDSCPPAARCLANWNLRAEFWIESVGDDYTVDTNQSGTYLYLATDQVRFYPIDAPQNYVHATGGGYFQSLRSAVPDPLPLESIPALVFSEIMRDVDLFVGVTSVGNDPAWLDGGREPRFAEYWSGYSFGTLSATAQTRKQVLEKLVPRLKIGPCCSFSDRFLVVRGDLRTYKIHLGSGNILMEPNDQYLCIVPNHGIGSSGKERIFLPFEGDNTLSIILSKAFLLAEDKKITDPTITRQII